MSLTQNQSAELMLIVPQNLPASDKNVRTLVS